jgi:hypothetical protein
MAKAISGPLFALAAVAGGFAGWALFGAVAKPDESAANTGATGATGPTGLTTESTLSPPSVSTLPPPSSTVPSTHNTHPHPHPASKGVFTIDGRVYNEEEYLDVTTGGYVKVLNYSGPSGCSNRFFYIGQTGAFRYTAHNALLQMADILYTFGVPPAVRGRSLVWAGTFTGGGRTDHVRAVVYCRLPAKSIPALPANGGG